jgi:enoyl-[acyl-carrier-protein] reductase (NADH)
MSPACWKMSSVTSKAGRVIRLAHNVSAYSLVALSRAALPLLEKSAQPAVIAMTY